MLIFKNFLKSSYYSQHLKGFLHIFTNFGCGTIRTNGTNS